MTKEDVENIIIPLRDECLDTISHHLGIGADQNKIVAIVRDYNRKWNNKKEEFPELREDGFILYMKPILIDVFRKIDSDGVLFVNALKYL